MKEKNIHLHDHENCSSEHRHQEIDRTYHVEGLECG